MSQFASDFAAANDLLAEAFGEEVTLVRGSTESGAVTAQVFTQEYAGQSDEGFATTVNFDDFIVDVGDYEFGAGAVEPRNGDRIKRTIDGTVHTYEVTPTADRRCCEWADTTGNEWKIHTNHIDP